LLPKAMSVDRLAALCISLFSGELKFGAVTKTVMLLDLSIFHGHLARGAE